MYISALRTTNSYFNIELIRRKACSYGISAQRGTITHSKRFKLMVNSKNRYFSTLNANRESQNQYRTTSQDDIQQYMSILPEVIKKLTESSRGIIDMKSLTKHQKNLLHYNVANKKHRIGHSVVTSYKLLENSEYLTTESVHLANILGWCTELLASAFNVNEDGSEIRQKEPCWYKKDVGRKAALDGQLLETMAYSLLKIYCSTLPCYASILDLFHDVTLNVAMGESLQGMLKQNGTPMLKFYTMSKYNAIVQYKTSYMVFKLPVGLAMYLANIQDPEVHKEANRILFKMGNFYQVQNDVLDCFGDHAVTGKDGHDIRNGKCTWLIVEALHRATLAQRRLLEDNFGRREPDCQNAVRAVYEDLDLLTSYSISRKLIFDLIIADIDKISNKRIQNLFYKFMEEFDNENQNMLMRCMR